MSGTGRYTLPGKRSASSSTWRSGQHRLDRNPGSARGSAISSRPGSKRGNWSGAAEAYSAITFRAASPARAAESSIKPDLSERLDLERVWVYPHSDLVDWCAKNGLLKK
jgi:hypothetical protein